MVALALSRRNKETASRPGTPLTESPPTNGNHALPAAIDAELATKQPKRSSSFGKGLGLASLTSSMSRAGDVMHGFGRSRSGASTPSTPALANPASETANGASSILGGGGGLGAGGAGAASASSMGPPATPDPSHLTQFSLKLSDLVNKAFVPCAPGAGAGAAGAARSAAGGGHGAFHGVPKIQNIAYEGKRLPDKVKILEIAHTVVSELRYAESVDPYLLRAVSRQILKALTLFAARIDSLLVSPTKDPQALRIPTNAKEGTYLSAALEFNIGLVTLEWIVEDSLERCIEGDRDARGDLITDEHGNVLAGMPHFVSEILTPVRQKMEGTILHVIQPLLVQTKASLTRCISAAVPLPFANPVSLSPSLTPGSSTSMNDIARSAALALTASGNASPPQKAADAVAPHHQQPAAAAPSALSDGLSSVWLRELEARLEGIRRLLIPRIEERCGQDGEGWFISVAIHVIWKGLLILTSRSVALPSSDATAGFALGSAVQQVVSESQRHAPSPAQLTQALKSVGVGVSKPKAAKEGSTSGSVPESGRQTPLQLGGASASAAALQQDQARLPPISQVSRKHVAHQIAELQTFEKLLVRFCDGFLKKGTGGTQKKAKLHRRARLPFFASSNQMAAELSLDLDDYNPDDEDELARAALAEAMHALKSTIIVLQTIEKEPKAICAALEHMAGHGPGNGENDDGAEATPGSSSENAAPSLTSEAARALDAIPNLPLAQLLYNRLPLGIGRLELPTPPAVFGYTWAEYERAIAGFAGGQSWAQALAVRMKLEVEVTWPLITRREAERITSLEKAGDAAAAARNVVGPNKATAATPNGGGGNSQGLLGRGLPRSRSRAPASTLAVSTLPPPSRSSSSGSSRRGGGTSDGESEASVAIDDDGMTRSVPDLDKRRSDLVNGARTLARSSDTDLVTPSGVSVGASASAGGSEAAMATASPSAMSPLPSTPSLPPPTTSEGASAVTNAKNATAPPRFWRRSSSTNRSAFHLTLSGLSRSSSPKPNVPRGRATSDESSDPAPSSAAIDPSLPLTSITPTHAAMTTSAQEDDEGTRLLESIKKEAQLERKSLRVFARMLEYVSQGEVCIGLD